MTSLFTIYNQRLAGYLMMNGFPLIEVVKNIKTGKNNYLFPNTTFLQGAIERWQLEKLKKQESRGLNYG